jgi:hypothetical protein
MQHGRSWGKETARFPGVFVHSKNFVSIKPGVFFRSDAH